MPKVPAEVTHESYLLRSTFFFNKLGSLGFFSLYKDIKKMGKQHKDALAWDERHKWNISEDAWKKIKEFDIDPILVFAHPKIIKIHPAYIRYYRSVALLPQKGLKTISKYSGIDNCEDGKMQMPESKVLPVVQAINEAMALIVKLASKFDEENIKGMMFATAGTTIDGSWRNAIGIEGERVVRSLILQNLLDNNEVIAFTDKKNKSSDLSEWEGRNPIDAIEEIKSISVKNGSSVVFSSEPDVTLMNSNGKTIGGIEIKAGLDPAGALERLGAMFKSFDNILAESPDAITILIASCITDEVDTRISASQSVRQKYILTDVINNRNKIGTKFANSIRATLGLISKRM